jgi:hypothetical protein
MSNVSMKYNRVATYRLVLLLNNYLHHTHTQDMYMKASHPAHSLVSVLLSYSGSSELV